MTGVVPDNVVVGGVPAKIIKRLDGKPLKDRIEPVANGNGVSTGKVKKVKTAPTESIKAAEASSTAPNGTTATKPAASQQKVDPAVDCFLANVPARLPVQTLRTALSAFGPVKRLSFDRRRRMGFVTFETPEGATAAIAKGQSETGLVVDPERGTVVGIERRRSPTAEADVSQATAEGADTVGGTSVRFNADLVVSTRCVVRGFAADLEEEDLQKALAAKFGPVKSVRLGERSKGAVALVDFEQLKSAREAVKISQPVAKGGEGGFLIGEERVKVEAKRSFSSASTARQAQS